jgi:hypothetical protein
MLAQFPQMACWPPQIYHVSKLNASEPVFWRHLRLTDKNSSGLPPSSQPKVMAKVMGNLRISLLFLLLFLTSALLYVASAEAGQGRVYPSCSNNATGRILSDACLQTTDVRYQTPLPT